MAPTARFPSQTITMKPAFIIATAAAAVVSTQAADPSYFRGLTSPYNIPGNEITQLIADKQICDGSVISFAQIGTAPSADSFLLATVSETEYTKCIKGLEAELGKLTQMSLAQTDKCFEEDGDGRGWSPINGGDSICPFPQGQTCFKGFFCQNGNPCTEWDATYTSCPWSPLDHDLIQIEYKAGKDNEINRFEDDDYREFLTSIQTAVSRSKGCTGNSDARTLNAQWDAPGWRYVNVRNVQSISECKSNAPKAAADAVAEWASEDGRKPYQVSLEIKSIKFPAKCWDNKSDLLEYNWPTCNGAIKGFVGNACTKNSQCGSGKCEPDTKECAPAGNSTVVAFVGPVLAAVLAVVFF